MEMRGKYMVRRAARLPVTMLFTFCGFSANCIRTSPGFVCVAGRERCVGRREMISHRNNTLDITGEIF